MTRAIKKTAIIEGGSVTARKDDAEAGGSGPWTYLYWSGDKDKYQVYSFESYGSQKGFEEFCKSLTEKGSS